MKKLEFHFIKTDWYWEIQQAIACYMESFLLAKYRNIDIACRMSLYILNERIGISTYPIKIMVEHRIVNQTSYTASITQQHGWQGLQIGDSTINPRQS